MGEGEPEEGRLGVRRDDDSNMLIGTPAFHTDRGHEWFRGWTALLRLGNPPSPA